MIFARKMPEFFIIIARKNIFPELGGGGTCPLPPSPTPMLTGATAVWSMTFRKNQDGNLAQVCAVYSLTSLISNSVFDWRTLETLFHHTRAPLRYRMRQFFSPSFARRRQHYTVEHQTLNHHAAAQPTTAIFNLDFPFDGRMMP